MENNIPMIQFARNNKNNKNNTKNRLMKELEKKLELELLESESDTESHIPVSHDDSHSDKNKKSKEYIEKLIVDNEIITNSIITTGKLFDHNVEHNIVSDKILSKNEKLVDMTNGKIVGMADEKIVGMTDEKSVAMIMNMTNEQFIDVIRSINNEHASQSNPLHTIINTKSAQKHDTGINAINTKINAVSTKINSPSAGTNAEISVNPLDTHNENPDAHNVNLLYYSHFFELNDRHKIFILNIADLICEICIVLFLHLVLGIHNSIFNIITIDGIISCIIFYMGFIGIEEKNNFLLKNRMLTLDRYIYYLLLFCGYYFFNYMTWFNFTGFAMYIASVMVCPSIIGQIYDIYAYKKIRQVLYDGYNRLVQKIICKQFSKIINMAIKNVLNLNIIVGYEELIPFYSHFSWIIINDFIVTFILACIFNHIDKKSIKLPMMIYKNLYMKDREYNISNDKLYLQKIIEDKKYEKFMDVYTLNRIIRMIVNDNTQNTILSEQIALFLQKVFFRLNRVMLCWTIMSISNLTMGIMGFLLFIPGEERPLRYIINTIFFAILSFHTMERIPIIILCDICYSIIDSKLLTDIIDDTYHSLKCGFLNCYYRTRLESVLLSMILTYLSYCNYNNLGILIVCILNLIVMFRLYRSSYIFSKKTDTEKIQKNNTERDQITDAGIENIFSVDAGICSEPDSYPDSSSDSSSDSSPASSPDASPDLFPDTEPSINGNVNRISDTMVSFYGSAFEFAEPFDILNILQNKNTKRMAPNDGILSLSLSQSQSQSQNQLIPKLQTHSHRIKHIPIKNTKSLNKVSNSISTFDESSINQDLVLDHIAHIQSIDDIQNKDILLIIKDRIKIVFKNNLLIKVLNPFKQVEQSAILRIFAHLFLLLMFGYISNFGTIHILILPIMVQNVIDIIS